MSKRHVDNITDDWLTPPELVRSLGRFDLDPCASKLQLCKLAEKSYCFPEDNGLLLPWEGRVWVNPPFSCISSWVYKFVLHANGVIICPLRLRVKWSQQLIEHADAIKFMREAVRWIPRDGTSKLNSLFDFMLVSIGENSYTILSQSLYNGIVFSPCKMLAYKV